MARENRRKRDERRFGCPELWADVLISRDWNIPSKVFVYGQSVVPILEDEYGQMKRIIAESKIIQSRNVCDYYMEECGPGGRFHDGFDVSRDLPSCVPPFGKTFVDCSLSSSHEGIPPHWGLLIQSYLKSDDPESSTVICHLIVETPSGNTSPILIISIQYNNKINIESISPIWYFPLAMIMSGRIPRDQLADDADPGFRFACSLASVALLAISFMNFKSITISQVDPDIHLNRERRRAGLKPFLRYHTININPMKEVLRTEGGIEANGLKKALHVCRGHFKTYTEDRPLFGHFSGTVWCPAHVRGSIKEGVVVSDYRVNPPATREKSE